nr:hypothetical protein CPGR_01843 [Mycolicibacterium malmesburyense]
MMFVKLRTAPPFTNTAAELNTDSTVAAAVVDFNGIVSPSVSKGAPGSGGYGGLIAMKISPRGVAERSSAVLPWGNWTPSMMRKVVTAV